MNFHSLLRVDAAKKRAEKYFLMEEEVMRMMDYIVNNKNFALDHQVMTPDPSKPKLNIYLGSDYGFCSNYNSQINDCLTKDQTSEKIILGRKTKKGMSHVLLQISKEEYEETPQQVEALVKESLLEQKNSEINIIYNRYHNASDIRLETKKIYPIEMEEKTEQSYYDDYLCEQDINDVLRNLVTLYLSYQLKLCNINANAAENVLRQNTTSESLKKIDERDEERLKINRKEKKAKEFRKVIESFSKTRER